MQVDFRHPQDAERYTREEFATSPLRLAHVLEVALHVQATAEKLNASGATPPIDIPLAYCAALVHDIGYLPQFKRTGCHSRDGFDMLCELGYPDLAELIVGHSSSPEEAELIGIRQPSPSSHIIAKLITYWDVQINQGGEVVSYETRLDDIIARHGAQSVVARANVLARPRIEELLAEVDRLVARPSRG